MDQDQLLTELFVVSSMSAKSILGGSFHDLHALAGIKINQQQKEIVDLKKQIKELESEIVVLKNTNNQI